MMRAYAIDMLALFGIAVLMVAAVLFAGAVAGP